MCLNVVFILACVAVVSASPTGADIEVADRYGSGFVDVNDITNLPLLGYIYKPSTSTKVGCGLIMASKWMLSIQHSVGEIVAVNPSLFLVYQNIVDPGTIATDASLVKHSIVKIVLQPGYNVKDFVYNLALIKVCPRFIGTNFFVLPSASQTYPVGQDLDAYIYRRGEGHLQKTTHKIVVDSVCSNIRPTYDPLYHYCVEGADDDHEINTSDRIATAFLMEGTQFRGIVVFTMSPEAIMLKVETHAAWISANMV